MSITKILVRKAFATNHARGARSRCTAPVRKGGRHCGRPVKIGRKSDGRTCGRVECATAINADWLF